MGYILCYKLAVINVGRYANAVIYGKRYGVRLLHSQLVYNGLAKNCKSRKNEITKIDNKMETIKKTKEENTELLNCPICKKKTPHMHKGFCQRANEKCSYDMEVEYVWCTVCGIGEYC